MRRMTGVMVAAALILGAQGAARPAHADCPMTTEAAVREHDGFTLEAAILDRKYVTVTVTNTGEGELLLLIQSWSLRIGYESSAAIPVSVPARKAHEIVLEPTPVAAGEVYSDKITMRSHRTRMATIDLLPAEAPCDEVIWVRLSYAVEVAGETVKGAANIQVSFTAE